jgi:hypothetical protein
MTQFYISLTIVLIGVALCIDWLKVLHKRWELFITILAYDNPVARYIRCVVRAYQAPPGRHRREQVAADDSEVDRWVGADDRFATLLHTMNRDFSMNDQARA